MPHSVRELTLTSVQERLPVEAVPVSSQQLAGAKAAYTTRRVPQAAMTTLIKGGVRPRPGDLLLARVDTIRQHKRIELANGRRADLFAGDQIIVCYGNRYAPDQFEAVTPDDLGPCSLVAAGGVAARALTRHQRMSAATLIRPVGILADTQRRPLNLADWALPRRPLPAERPYTIAVVGTSMNAGKTTTAAYTIRGLASAGLRVGAAKITGTGAGGDIWMMRDAGATTVLDFTDAGLVSTYRVPLPDLEAAFSTLVAHLAGDTTGAIVLEIADGLYQQETAALLGAPLFAETIDEVIFAATDAMGAAAGVAWLQAKNLPATAVSGALTQAPLAMREAAAASALPVVDLVTLSDPSRSPVVARLMGVQEEAWHRRAS